MVEEEFEMIKKGSTFWSCGDKVSIDDCHGAAIARIFLWGDKVIAHEEIDDDCVWCCCL